MGLAFRGGVSGVAGGTGHAIRLAVVELPPSVNERPCPRIHRTRIGEFLGRIRDLEAEWTQEAVQRVTTENATLKQRVRELTDENRTLDTNDSSRLLSKPNPNQSIGWAARGPRSREPKF